MKKLLFILFFCLSGLLYAVPLTGLWDIEFGEDVTSAVAKMEKRGFTADYTHLTSNDYIAFSKENEFYIGMFNFNKILIYFENSNICEIDLYSNFDANKNPYDLDDYILTYTALKQVFISKYNCTLFGSQSPYREFYMTENYKIINFETIENVTTNTFNYSISLIAYSPEL